MAGAALNVQVDDQATRRALADLIARLRDPAPALRDVGEYEVRRTDEHFRRQAGPDGTAWPALSEVTLARLLARKKGLKKSGAISKRGEKLLANKRILRDSGILQDTIRYQLTADGQGVAIGTDRIYGAMQQFGGTRAQWPHLWGDIPARPYLGTSPEDEAEILAIFKRHLVAGM